MNERHECDKRGNRRHHRYHHASRRENKPRAVIYLKELSGSICAALDYAMHFEPEEIQVIGVGSCTNPEDLSAALLRILEKGIDLILGDGKAIDLRDARNAPWLDVLQHLSLGIPMRKFVFQAESLEEAQSFRMACVGMGLSGAMKIVVGSSERPTVEVMAEVFITREIVREIMLRVSWSEPEIHESTDDLIVLYREAVKLVPSSGATAN